MKNVIIAGLAVTTVASLVGNALLYQRYSTNRPLVRIGSDVITKKQYQDALDYQTQGNILKKMVFADLVRQAAAKQGVTPADKDVDARITLIQRTNPRVLEAANQDAAKMADFRDNLKTDMALDNLRSQGIPMTDAEVAEFYNRNKQAFAQPTQIQTTLVVAENSVDASTAASLLKQNMPVDVIGRQPRLHVVGLNNFHPDFNALGAAVNQDISRQVLGMKQGDVKTIPLGSQGKEFAIIRANKNSGAGVPPLSQIKAQVAQFARLQKAPSPSAEIAKLYKGGSVSFEMDKYAGYFGDVQNAAPEDTAAKKTASNL